LIEVWIDQTERRTWFLNEIVNAPEMEYVPLRKAASGD